MSGLQRCTTAGKLQRCTTEGKIQRCSGGGGGCTCPCNSTQGPVTVSIPGSPTFPCNLGGTYGFYSYSCDDTSVPGVTICTWAWVLTLTGTNIATLIVQYRSDTGVYSAGIREQFVGIYVEYGHQRTGGTTGGELLPVSVSCSSGVMTFSFSLPGVNNFPNGWYDCSSLTAAVTL